MTVYILFDTILVMIPLEVENLKKHYLSPFLRRKKFVLEDMSFSLPSGKITGFLGGNGAGKTTTLKCLFRLCRASGGRISFFGSENWDLSIKKRIGFLPENPYFYQHLTGLEFLQFYGRLSTSLSSKVLKDRCETLLKKMRLFDFRFHSLNKYSKGMLQKIGMAQALIHDPELIILDEPLSGLDPDGRNIISELMVEAYKEGRTIFFSSHLLSDVEKICNHLVILKDGKVLYEGAKSLLLEQFHKGVKIVFKDKEQLHTIEAENSLKAQEQIDTLRSRGCEIISVADHYSPLEDIFIALMSDSSGAVTSFKM